MLKQILINKAEGQALNSNRIPIEINQQYKVKTTVIGKKGEPFSSYFTVILTDDLKKETARYVRWIKDFTGKPRDYTIIFTNVSGAKFATISYRFNKQTPVASDLDVEVEDINALELEKTGSKIEEFDDLNEYKQRKPLENTVELNQKQEAALESKLVWVFGSARSGTTWFAIRLLKHPDNINWNEPWIGHHLGALMYGDDIVKAARKPGEQILFKRNYDLQRSGNEYFFSRDHKSNWLPALRRLILARAYSQARTFDKNVIIKEPNGSQGADIIMECLPNSKMIFLVRDGRDVVDSRIDMHRPGSWSSLPALTSPEARMEAIIKYSAVWKLVASTSLQAYNNHDPSRRLLLKYEELRDTTFQQLKKVYNFIGVDLDDNDLRKIVETYDFNTIPESERGAGKFNRTAKVGGWKDNFTPAEQEKMNSIMGETLAMLGYKI